MTFHVQYLDAPSNQPIIQYQAQFPLPVPRRGDKVTLFEEETTTPKVEGVVVDVRWGYKPRTYDDLPDLDIAVQVWLEREPD